MSSVKWQWPKWSFERYKLNKLGADMDYSGGAVWSMFGWRFTLGFNADSMKGTWNFGAFKFLATRITR